MVRHIIIWTLKRSLTEEEKTWALLKAKRGLEGLKGKIDGLESIKVQIDNLDSSTADMLLDCTLRDEEALYAYQHDPMHLEVAKFIREITCDRRCIDYII
ncbi:MAG: Dabb family protein [Ruminococcus sp.]|nr:Dabb family protein [Ruminococcus sp.]